MINPIRLFAASAVAASILLTVSVPSNATTDRPFQEIATEILSGLDSVTADQLPARSGYGAPTITIRPLDKRNGATGADGYNQRLLAALQQQAKGRFEFVSRETLDRLVDDIRRSDLPQNDAANRIADLKAGSRADVVISGSVRLERGVPVISYQAASTETARIFISTRPRALPRRGNIVHQAKAAKMPISGFSRVVAETESLLADLGYDPGPVDGFMTAKTRSALSAYQADSALPVNGRMTSRAVENMRRDTR